ncbi:DUF951 domain-containing protein [Periweissella ghanensis]|uniref:DUF951 domain-containing protein n=1 Tax=Periweissella ghanensis TaxID=467997 RepID=A0ABM8ZCF9_9LACO|nr:DUF951 domain-containing protein [Periweissella ghanensis]MCM0600147.1 DUF951 domain-containing protein [Periweissella ghanensis]CAH0419205.1 hypothetical protein WGH24286_01652 [Periweissella ghanensis]
MEYNVTDIVEMKKPHACKTNAWEILRVGADIKIKCVNCGHQIMMSRNDFNHRVKRVLESHATDEA